MTDIRLTRWGLVYYNNLLALILMPAGVTVTGEYQKILESVNAGEFYARLSQPEVQFPVALSCAFGLSISFFALNARKALTATAFTVLGVVCKFGTVFVNTVVWKSHASPTGIFFVCVCIGGGVLFQQLQGSQVITPVKKEDPEKEPADIPDETVGGKSSSKA